MNFGILNFGINGPEPLGPRAEWFRDAIHLVPGVLVTLMHILLLSSLGENH